MYHEYLLRRPYITLPVHIYLIYTTLLIPGTMKQNQCIVREKFMMHYKNSIPTSLSSTNNLLAQLCSIMNCFIHQRYIAKYIYLGGWLEILLFFILYFLILIHIHHFPPHYRRTSKIQVTQEKEVILWSKYAVLGMQKKNK